MVFLGTTIRNEGAFWDHERLALAKNRNGFLRATVGRKLRAAMKFRL